MNTIDKINELARLELANIVVDAMVKAKVFKKENYYLIELLDLDKLVYEEELFENEDNIILKYENKGYFIITNNVVKFETDTEIIDESKIAGEVSIAKNITYEDLAKLPEDLYEQIKLKLSEVSDWVNVYISKVGEKLKIADPENGKIVWVDLKSDIDGILAFIKEKLIHLVAHTDVSVVFGFIVVFSFAFYMLLKKIFKVVLSIFRKKKKAETQVESIIYEFDIKDKILKAASQFGTIVKTIAKIVIDIIKAIFEKSSNLIKNIINHIHKLLKTSYSSIRKVIAQRTEKGINLKERHKILTIQ